MIGQKVLHYEIVEKLGEGGMGVVYKARDNHLNRFVAIKVLPPEKVADEDRKARFVREAKSASALNHPNIVHVYDISRDAGIEFIAMEYVAGQRLDQLIGGKAMRLNETLQYAIQIADAVARAHESGIVHRDLKPANIMVDEHGLVKVLDFGLAKLTEALSIDESAATETMRTVTEAGSIVGTAAYMSPEQAQGKKVDARSDIFSFGSVLYEMLTGRRAFQGETPVATQSAVLTAEPRPVRESNAAAGPEMEKLVARCLRKDPARRFQSMADVKVSLEDLRDQPESVASAAPVQAPGRWRPAVFAALGIVAGAVAGAYWIRSRPANPRPVSLTRITSDPGISGWPAISADGKLVAFASDRSGEGNLDIWVRQASGGEPIRITHDPAQDREPRFSPDGSLIAFHSDRDGGGIYLVSALGGEERLLVRDGSAPRFSPDGKWISYLAGGEGGVTGQRFIKVIALSGGKPIPIRSDLLGLLVGIWSPDSRSLLLSGADARRRANEMCVVSIETSAARCLDAGAAMKEMGFSSPVVHEWAGGYVYLTARYGEAEGIWRVPLAPTDQRLSRKAERLASGAGEESDPSIAIRADGTSLIAFSIQAENRDIWVVPLGPDGAANGSGARVTSDLLADHYPALSADGHWLAYASGPGIRLKDLRDGKDRLVLDRANLGADRVMALTADGRRLAFRLGPTVVGLNLSDNTRETLLERGIRPEAWTRDGRWLLLMTFDTNELLLLDVASRRLATILSRPGWRLHSGRFSPDDRWVAFHAAPSPTTRRIYIAPFREASPIPPEEWIPVTDGRNLDREPRWSPNGRLIYFLSDRDGFRCVWAQAVDPATHAAKGSPFAVYHTHSARFTLDLGNDTGPNGLSIVAGKMITTIAEKTGNVWLATIR